MKHIWSIFFFAVLIFALACGGEEGEDNGETATTSAEKEVVSGEKVYRQYCVACHGIDGSMAQNEAKDLKMSEMSMDERVAIITNGKGLMTPFGTILKEEQIHAVAEYTQTLKEN